MKIDALTVREKVGLGMALAGFISQVQWEYVPMDVEPLTWWLIWACFGAVIVAGLFIALWSPKYNLDAALKRRHEVSSAVVSPRSEP